MARLFHDGHLTLSCSEACHTARGSAGGEDFACKVGTPVYATFAGTWRFRVAGTGGHTVTGISAARAGAIAECMHMSRSAGLVLGGGAAYYREGALLGYSGGAKGAPGSGSSTGPHMHEHGIWNGVRQGIQSFLAKYNASAPAGGGTTPIPTTPVTTKGRKMLLSGTTAGGGFLVTENGSTPVDGQEYSLFYRLINADQGKNPLAVSMDFPMVYLDVEFGIMDRVLARANKSGPTGTMSPEQIELMSTRVAALTAPIVAKADDAEHAQIIAAIGQIAQAPTANLAPVLEAIAANSAAIANLPEATRRRLVDALSA